MGLPDLQPGWSTAQLIEVYWPYVESYARAQWRNLPRQRKFGLDEDDISGMAAEALISACRSWPQFLAERSIQNPSTGGFWGYMRTRVDWEFQGFLKQDHPAKWSIDETLENGDPDPARELMMSEVNRYRRPSLEHQLIVDFISTLRTKETLFLALRYFEELPLAQIAELVELNVTGIQRTIHETTTKISVHALNLFADEPVEVKPRRAYPAWEPPAIVREWVEQTHGCSLAEYLGWAIRSYRSDARYLVDFIDRARGEQQKFGLRGKMRDVGKLTAQQKADMIRRLRGGESRSALADLFGVSQSTVDRYAARVYDDEGYDAAKLARIA